MTDVPATPAPVAAAPQRPAAPAAGVSYVDWSAIIAGAAVAAAIAYVMLSFGAGLGLAIVSAEPGAGASATLVLIAGALWLLWIQISAFLAGGYVAGRLRARVGDATAHEVEVRDAAHGLSVWAAAVVVGGVIAAMGLTGAFSAAATGGASVAAAEVEAADDSAAAYVADRTMRGAGGAAPAETRGEIARIVTAAVAEGELPSEDRAYLVDLVAETTTLTEAEAETRVAETEAWIARSAEAASDAAERARISGVIVAFLTAAALLAGAAAATLAAQVGGRHRDEGVVVPYLAYR